MGSINLGIRFLLELCMLAALAVAFALVAAVNSALLFVWEQRAA